MEIFWPFWSEKEEEERKERERESLVSPNASLPSERAMSSSQDSGTHMQRERSNSSLTSGETKYVPKLPSKDGGFKLGSRGR